MQLQFSLSSPQPRKTHLFLPIQHQNLFLSQINIYLSEKKLFKGFHFSKKKMFSSSSKSVNHHFLPQNISPLYNFESPISFTPSEILLHHHNNAEMLSSYYDYHNLVPNSNNDNNALVIDPVYEVPPPEVSLMQNWDEDLSSYLPVIRKHAVKKDRHSKIFTAKGPRDRRVRLSINVARKFFDLQDMLGVDKPSKTLDWLLNKSKTAIKELVQMTKGAPSSPSVGEVVCKNGKGCKKNLCGGKGGNKKSSQARESRAKARARARERTREKLSVKRLNESNPATTSCLDQVCHNNKGIGEHNILHFPLINNDYDYYNNGAKFGITTTEDIIDESIVIKRKVKPASSPVLGFHQRQKLIVSRDSNSSNFVTTSSPNVVSASSDNWDISSITTQSSLCATIFDEQRFIKSISNI